MQFTLLVVALMASVASAANCFCSAANGGVCAELAAGEGLTCADVCSAAFGGTYSLC